MSDVSRGFCNLLGLFQDSSNVSPMNDIPSGFLKIDQKNEIHWKNFHHCWMYHFISFASLQYLFSFDWTIYFDTFCMSSIIIEMCKKEFHKRTKKRFSLETESNLLWLIFISFTHKRNTKSFVLGDIKRMFN